MRWVTLQLCARCQRCCSEVDHTTTLPFCYLADVRTQPIQGPGTASLWYAVIGGYTHLSGGKYFTSLYGAPPVSATGGAGLCASCQWREAVCSQEELQGNKSKPLSPRGTAVLCSSIRFVLKHTISFEIYKTVTQCVRQSMRKKHSQITVTAEESHKS